MDPHVLRVRARSCEINASQTFDLMRSEHYVAISPTEQHVLLRTSNYSLRLDVISGTVFAGPVMFEVCLNLSGLKHQIDQVRKLGALLQNVSLRDRIDARLNRLVLALRALDARNEGASLREIAIGILGATEWPGDAENIKSRARRLVSLAQKLRQAGPPGVLRREL